MWILSLGFANEETAQKGFEQMQELGFMPGTPHDYGYGPGSMAVQQDLVYACGNALDLIERLYEDQEIRNRIHKDLIDQLRIAVKRRSVKKPSLKTIQHSRITDFIRTDVDLVALYIMCIQEGMPCPDEEDINKLEEKWRSTPNYEEVIRNLSTWITEHFPMLPTVYPYKSENPFTAHLTNDLL